MNPAEAARWPSLRVSRQRPESPKLKLLKLLPDPSAQTIVVEIRKPEALTRFGREYVEPSHAARGRTLVVGSPGVVKNKLVQDRVEVLTILSARPYGRRSGRKQAKKARAALETQ